MPTEKADVYTLARFGDLESFKQKFVIGQINRKNELGTGLLHYSIAGENGDISFFLINNGIDVNMQDEEGNTPLHLICEHPNIDVAREIIKNGGDLNIRNKYGNNCMWSAVFNCKGRYYDIVELFMKFNPDITTKNKSGKSPLDFARQVGNEKLIRILEG